jgi:hypothetical protein
MYEACDKLSGRPLHKCNVAVKFMNTNAPQHRRRKLITRQKLESLEEKSTNIFTNNFIDTYYPQRPDSLKLKSMFHVFTWYEYQSKPPKTMVNEKGGLHVELPDQLGFLTKRCAPKFIRTYMPKPDVPETKEDYFRRLLMMFKPWRNEYVDLMDGCESYQESYEKNKDDISVEANKYLSQRHRMDQTDKLIQRLREEATTLANNDLVSSQVPPILENDYDGVVERSVFICDKVIS